MAKGGWKGKAGENNREKKVGAADDTFHNCKRFSWTGLGLGDAMEPAY